MRLPMLPSPTPRHHLHSPLLLLLLLLPTSARHLRTVLELGGRYYYDVSALLANKTFQVG